MGAIEKYLAETQDSIPIFEFIVNFLLTFICSWILSKVYKTYGTSISDRSLFSKNFIFISLTTMLIITIIKSSLALSLGLVGALSIIRFRTAIKEPEELMFLFISIALGLGFGANQTFITLIGYVLIIIAIVLLSNTSENKFEKNNMLIEITSSNKLIQINDIKKIIMDNSKEVELKRYDRNSENIEYIFIAKLVDSIHLENIDQEVTKLDPGIKISFIDYSSSS
tara:strand:+ start:315 stop:989 length:675 start_codon:yes stop_codon:yes gene_type:complete